MNRILWNERDLDIDEIVISKPAMVHIEQMHDRCLWIGIYLDGKPDGPYWMGNFVCDSRGRMRFVEQEQHGFEWDRDDTHEVEAALLPIDDSASPRSIGGEG